MQFLAQISETKTFRANLTGYNCSLGQDLSALKFCLMIRTTRCWVAAPEFVILRKNCSFWLLS